MVSKVKNMTVFSGAGIFKESNVLCNKLAHHATCIREGGFFICGHVPQIAGFTMGTAYNAIGLFSLYATGTFNADYHRTSMKNGGMVICVFLVYPVLIYNELVICEIEYQVGIPGNSYRTLPWSDVLQGEIRPSI